MFVVRNHGRALYSPFLVGSRRWAATRGSLKLGPDIYKPHGPLAAELAATDIWKTAGNGHMRRHKLYDAKRVNLVSEQLCDDVFSYVGHTLDRHRGCDIIDLYPGVGMWSKRLNEYLQPRSHILLEPDAKLYEPYLQPLLDKPGTTLLPKDGIVWRDLNAVLTPEYLPHQVMPDEEDRHRRNDTLLVTANLVSQPKRGFMTFDSVANLLLYQFVNALRAGTLFHRYGQVRMLIWVRADDKQNFLPKNLQRRTKMGMEAELLCEWIHEICGNDEMLSTWFTRDENINQASLTDTIQRMQALNFRMPSGRGTENFNRALATVESGAELPVLGTEPPVINRLYREFLASIDASIDPDAGERVQTTEERVARWRGKVDDKKHRLFLEYLQELDAIKARLRAGETLKDVEPQALEWSRKLSVEQTQRRDEFLTFNENMHLYRQDPPAMLWDRRHYEPMEVQPEEFYPAVPGALLDIQPKAPHPLLRRGAPKSNDTSNVFDIIFKTALAKGAAPIGPQLDALWPGAADYIMPRMTSARDWDRGGFLGVRFSETRARSMNARQWEQLIELWDEWPFRPEFNELLGRTQEESEQSLDEALGEF
ncbi:S-adenosyl-L-methionine-dependent methyltransferase [Xylariaceae sp. FL0594]|nr:S-adenosyl-L-methionine-dependent methyltransferase [Xylariaceae sp. FL0594]